MSKPDAVEALLAQEQARADYAEVEAAASACPDCEDLRQQVAEAHRALESLTPGGSEFEGDPARCVDYVHRAYAIAARVPKEVKRRKAAEAALAEAQERVRVLAEAVVAQEEYNITGFDCSEQPECAKRPLDEIESCCSQTICLAQVRLEEPLRKKWSPALPIARAVLAGKKVPDDGDADVDA